jgi:hypothetical protein
MLEMKIKLELRIEIIKKLNMNKNLKKMEASKFWKINTISNCILRANRAIISAIIKIISLKA